MLQMKTQSKKKPSKAIRVDDEVYRHIRILAVGFETPNKTLRRHFKIKGTKNESSQ